MPYLSEYYLDLLTSEYRSSKRMNDWLNANLKIFQGILSCTRKFLPEFGIDTARGVQLDVLGEIIGQRRQVDFQPSHRGNPILDDETYRLLLRARIYQNHWDGKIASAMDIWEKLFPGGSLVIDDHQDMSATVYFAGAFTPMIMDLIEHGYIIPRPEGVLYNRTNFLKDVPLLGFDRDDAFVAGFDKGYFIP